MIQPTSTLAGFPPHRFRILGACSICNHTNWLDRTQIPEHMEIAKLCEQITCKACGSRDCGIRIVYAGGGYIWIGHPAPNPSLAQFCIVWE